MRPRKPISFCLAAVLAALCFIAGCSNLSMPRLEAPWRILPHRRAAALSRPATPQPPPTPAPSAEGNNAGQWQVGAKDRGYTCWYGRKHQGLPTADGGRFNRFAFTAAHPSIPFGTVIRVRNLTNQREVVVRVTDRCLGTKGRILDLSQAAAEAIGIIECGTDVVEVEVQPPSTRVPEALAMAGAPRGARKASAASRSARHRSRPLAAVRGARHKTASRGKTRLGAISSASSPGQPVGQ